MTKLTTAATTQVALRGLVPETHYRIACRNVNKIGTSLETPVFSTTTSALRVVCTANASALSS